MQSKHAEWKRPGRKEHVMWFHSARTLYNVNQSTETESWSVGVRGYGKERGRERLQPSKRKCLGVPCPRCGDGPTWCACVWKLSTASSPGCAFRSRAISRRVCASVIWWTPPNALLRSQGVSSLTLVCPKHRWLWLQPNAALTCWSQHAGWGVLCATGDSYLQIHVCECTYIIWSLLSPPSLKRETETCEVMWQA